MFGKKLPLIIFNFIIWVTINAQNVGIGISNPSALLHVNGTFKLTDGTQGDGKVLVSDNLGKASWQAMSGQPTGDENVAGLGDWNECISPNITAFQTFGGDQTEGFMGRNVAMTENYSFVGQSAYDTLGRLNTGIVIVYKLIGNAWVEVQRIADVVGQADAYFGWSVAATENVLLIGAPSETVTGYFRAGSVSVYNFNGSNWEFKQKIVIAAPAPYDNFGWSVDIDGDYFVVGANGYSTVGRAFVYKYVTGDWIYFTELPNLGGSASDQFGETVAISGDLIAIGCPKREVDSLDAGSVFLYKRAGSAYNLKTQLFPQNYGFTQNNLANFGQSVAMDGNYLLVGAPGFKVAGKSIGAIALYEFDGSVMNFIASYKNNSYSNGDAFGTNVAISYPYCMATAPGADQEGSPDVGICKLYKFNNRNLVLISDIIDPMGESAYNVYYLAINNISKRFLIGNPHRNNQLGVVLFGKAKI
jgi:hypothetical protein